MWSRRYAVAVHRFLRQEKPTGLSPAVKLGHQAVSLGLETLDVAQAHELALRKLSPPKDSPGNAGQERRKRADTFFKETLVPIEATHRAARKADSRIDRLKHTLEQHTTESSVSEEQLEQAVSRREAAEASAEAHAARHDKLLAEAQRLQKPLRERMRAILSRQEGEREQLGAELRDEIAQALLAINLSLLALKTPGPIDTEKTEKSIADALRILKQLRTPGRLSGDG